MAVRGGIVFGLILSKCSFLWLVSKLPTLVLIRKAYSKSTFLHDINILIKKKPDHTNDEDIPGAMTTNVEAPPFLL